MIYSASLLLRSALLISMALSSINPACGMDPKKLHGDLSPHHSNSPSPQSSPDPSDHEEEGTPAADGGAEIAAILPVGELALAEAPLEVMAVSEAHMKPQLDHLISIFFQVTNHATYQAAPLKYNLTNNNLTPIPLTSPTDALNFAQNIRHPANNNRPFASLVTVRGHVSSVFSKDCTQKKPQGSTYPTCHYNLPKVAPSAGHPLNYIQSFKPESRLINQIQKAGTIMASLHSYKKSKSGKNGFFEDVSALATAAGADALQVVKDFALNTLRVLKHSPKGLVGSQALQEEAIHLASLFLTAERLRSEKALDEAYIKLHGLKHLLLLPGQTAIQALEGFFTNLVFAPSGGGANAIDTMDPMTLATTFATVFAEYDRKPNDYKRRVSRSRYIIKRLTHLQHIHGFQPDTHGYILQANGLAPTAFGTHLPPNAQQFPNIPANYTHIFTSGVANACLFNAVAVANAAATGQSQAQQAALASRGGRAARQEAAAKMRAKLTQEQANLPSSTMAEHLLADLSHYLEGHPTHVQSLWGALTAAAGQGNAALNPPANPTTAEINTFLADTLDTGGNSPWLFAFLHAYIQEIEDRETMEGTPMINLLAHAYGHPITLHAPLANMGFEGTYGQTQAAPTLHIYITNYMGANVTSANDLNHYNALIPPPAEAPVPLTQIPAQVATTTLAAPTPATQASAQVVTMPIAPVLAAQAPAQPAKKPTHLLRFTSM